MEIITTPWYETRSLISPQIEMLQKDGMVQYKGSFLKDESPKTATLKKRYIQYNASYIKYCILKELYQAVFDGARGEIVEDASQQLIDLARDTIIEFAQYCEEQSLEENARELFRSFCKLHLFT